MAESTDQRRGFTLVEAVIVAVVIVVILAVTIPYVSTISELDRRDASKSNLLGLGQAMKMYAYAAYADELELEDYLSRDYPYGPVGDRSQ